MRNIGDAEFARYIANTYHWHRRFSGYLANAVPYFTSVVGEVYLAERTENGAEIETAPPRKAGAIGGFKYVETADGNKYIILSFGDTWAETRGWPELLDYLSPQKPLDAEPGSARDRWFKARQRDIAALF